MVGWEAEVIGYINQRNSLTRTVNGYEDFGAEIQGRVIDRTMDEIWQSLHMCFKSHRSLLLLGILSVGR